jgi:hypothetical protein
MRRYAHKSSLVAYAKRHHYFHIEDYEGYCSFKTIEGLMNQVAYSMDVNGNKDGVLWIGDTTGAKYYCTNPSALVRV